jgi:hypothetical protein
MDKYLPATIGIARLPSTSRLSVSYGIDVAQDFIARDDCPGSARETALIHVDVETRSPCKKAALITCLTRKSWRAR